MNGKLNRRQQILEVLAGELETKPGARISTATLAAAVGVSEAALYRHFASKAQMFEALIEFAEDTVFALFNQIMREQKDARVRCLHLTTALLRFASRNPGITRILVGDILVGEHQRLRARVSKFFARVETHFKQVLRESNLADTTAMNSAEVVATARLLLTVVVGRLDHYVREDFAESPEADWERQWALLNRGVFNA